MLVGVDFEKIQFVLFGLNLTEPMAFITDSLLFVISIILAFLLNNVKSNHPSKTYWIWFFIVFGVGAFLGGIGHTFVNYLGIGGKFPSWIAGPISIYLLEQGVIAAHPNENKLSLFKIISFWKMIFVYVAFGLVYYFAPIERVFELPFLPIAINTIIGVILTAGFLANSYRQKVDPSFKYMIIGVLVLLPTAFIFLLKININPWFDKNDFSHVLMAIGIIFFYLGVKKNLLKLKV